MLELTTAPRPSSQRQKRPERQTAAPATTEPTLITEQQVLFGTAAAALPAARRRHWNVAGLVRAMFAHAGEPHVRHDYPKRYDYLERSAMARAMYRL
jgi:hypothetical protein